MNELVRQMFMPSGVLFFPLIIGLLGSLSFGIVGSYVVVRRISYAAHGISHTVLLGIGLAVFLKQAAGLSRLSPLVGAFAAALLAAWIIGASTLYAPHRADSVISAVTVLGLSGGLIFLALTPGYFDPMSVLFGDILLVNLSDAWRIGLLNLAIVLTGLLFYVRLQMVCFDEEFARLRGIHVEFWFILLLMLTAVTVVIMMQIVGLVLVTALLTLPAMTALRFSHNLRQSMIYASLICAACVTGGLALSYPLDLPCGPVIVLLAGAVYLVALCFRRRAC
jgi:zinc transport system permease protein